MIKLKSGFAFLELLLASAIIMFIAYLAFKAYFKKTPLDKETQKAVSEQGIDTTSYKSTIDSTRNKVEDIQNKHFDELNKLE